MLGRDVIMGAVKNTKVALSFTIAPYSLVDFLTEPIMVSCPSVLALR